MSRPEASLRRRLLAWLLAPLLVLMVLDTAVSGWTSLRAADIAQDRALHEVARELVLHVRLAPDGPVFELSPSAERLLLVDPDDRLSYRIALADGRTLAGDPALAAAARPPTRREGAIRSYSDRLLGEPVRVVATWLAPEHAPAGELVMVQVAETLHHRNTLAGEILAHAIVPQLLLIAMASLAVPLGIAAGLEPLRRLREAVASRSHRDLRPVPSEEAPAEVRPLLDEVNDLMARLGQTLELQQRFIADAAHQLKTPVSGLKAQIELALRESDPQRQRHTMAQLYLGVDRLSHLVRQLLALARNEPGAIESLRLQPMDLNAFALEVSMDWAPPALRRHIDLGFEAAPGPLMIDADAERLRELLNNLIDNAVRYSREGGRVTVAVGEGSAEGEAGEQRDEVWLAVHDDGPRIPPEERDRIFERFHRLLGAPAEGSGLGLAIVSEIATLHGARIRLEEDSDGVGNRFSVWFHRSGSTTSRRHIL